MKFRNGWNLGMDPEERPTPKTDNDLYFFQKIKTNTVLIVGSIFLNRFPSMFQTEFFYIKIQLLTTKFTKYVDVYLLKAKSICSRSLLLE